MESRERGGTGFPNLDVSAIEFEADFMTGKNFQSEFRVLKVSEMTGISMWIKQNTFII